jgi:hypothetical protein
MGISLVFEKRILLHKKNLISHTKDTTMLKSVENDNGFILNKEVKHGNYILLVEQNNERKKYVSAMPIPETFSDEIKTSHTKYLWINVNLGSNQKNELGMENICDDIVKELIKSNTTNIQVKCSSFIRTTENIAYPFRIISSTKYYEFFVKYQCHNSSHYYSFKTTKRPRSIDDIANLRYLIYLDTLDLDDCKGEISPISMIMAPNAIINTLDFLLFNRGNYKKKRKRRYFDKKLTIISNPHNPLHSGTEKTVDGKRAKAVTLVKGGVLLHLPLNFEESKKAGQKYIRNSFESLEVPGGKKTLNEIMKNSNNTLFIYELRGEIGDDGNYSGIIKNGFLIKDGIFVSRLCNRPVNFNIFNIYNHIEYLSCERVSLGTFLFPYIRFRLFVPKGFNTPPQTQRQFKADAEQEGFIGKQSR